MDTSREIAADAEVALHGALGGARRRGPGTSPVKRAFDVAASLLLIAAFLPAMALLFLLVAAGGGSPMFGHVRVGLDGRTFRCWKFRTMVPNAQQVLQDLLARDPAARAEWEANHKLARDPRVTPLGRFLRKSSLDEMPQLLNVLLGDMSLVGPRPITREEVARYGANIAEYYACRPGITGAWQVSGRNDVDYARRVELDVAYARHWSIGTDAWILLRTVLVVLRGTGAS